MGRRMGRPTAPLTISDEVIRAHVASGMSCRELAALCKCGRTKIFNHVRDHGLGPWAIKPGPRYAGDSPPPDFVDKWRGMAVRVLARHYGRSERTVQRWVVECGLKRVTVPPVPVAKPKAVTAPAPNKLARPAPAKSAYMTAPVDRGYRDWSPVGQAVDFLRRFGPVYRCRATGAAADLDSGTHWRRGSAILTDAEIVERAERLGFGRQAA